jgi:hypothetical protein
MKQNERGSELGLGGKKSKLFFGALLSPHCFVDVRIRSLSFFVSSSQLTQSEIHREQSNAAFNHQRG